MASGALLMLGLWGTLIAQVSAPTLLQGQPPSYPEDVEGPPLRLWVSAWVDEQGRASAQALVRVEPALPAQRQALVLALVQEAIARMVFEPARQGDSPQAARVTLELELTPAQPPGLRAAQRVRLRARASASAQAASERASAQAASAPPVESVTTQAQVDAQGQAPSALTLRMGALADVPRQSAEQALTMVPGVILSNHGGQGHPSAIFMRGFDAGEGQDLAFSVMGTPLNDPSNPHGHGFADTSWIMPEVIAALRVVEGPFDPAQGDFAVAGSVDFDLGVAQPGLTLSAQLGQFRTRRGVATWAGSLGQGQAWVAADLGRGDGFGPERAWSAARLMAGYQRQGVRAWIQSASNRFASAGVVRQEDLDAGRLRCASAQARLCSYAPGQGGQLARHGGAVQWSGQAGRGRWRQLLHGALRRVALREDFTGFLTDLRPDGPQRGDRLLSTYETTALGASGDLVYPARVGAGQAEIELGYLARVDSGDAGQRRLRAVGGAPYAATIDQALDITHLGAHLSARWRWTPSVQTTLGGRVDSFGFRVWDRARPLQDRQGARLAQELTEASGVAASPRASLRVDLAQGLRWITALGRGVRSSDAAALSQGELAPFARTMAAETGLWADHRLASWRLQARLSAFETYVDRDLIFDEVAGRNTFAGATHRFGALTWWRARWGQRLDAMTSLTYTEAHQPPPDAPWWQLTAGPRLPYIPRWVWRAELAWREPHLATVSGGALSARAAAGLTWMSPRPLPLEQFGRAQQRLDASAALAWRGLALGAQVTNLLDQPYREAEFYYESNFSGPTSPPSRRAALHVIAGAPRTWLLTLSWHLDGVPPGGDDASPSAEPLGADDDDGAAAGEL